MYTKQPKRNIILNILDILRKYTDENHRLSQRDIAEILKNEYEMTVDRKAIKRNLMNLIECGYDIEYSESVRMFKDKNGEPYENIVLTDFYLNREFTDSELRLLIDSVLFSNHIPYEQDKELIKKLEGLSNVHFKSRVKHVSSMPKEKTDNKQLFLNIEILDEAIDKGKKVRFHYLEYHSDKKLHKRVQSDGKVREYLISPYQLAAREGKYYLICSLEKYQDITNYRVDRIANIEILDDNVKPFNTLQGSDGRPLDLKDYMGKHIYMCFGDNIRAEFRADKSILSDIIDVFGKDIRFSGETDKQITVTASVNEMAMEQFALSFAPWIEVISPIKLREKMIKNLSAGLEKYK